MNINEKDWLLVNNGLQSPTVVHLIKDEGNYFSAWFYNLDYGVDCADVSTFHIDDCTNVRKMCKEDIDIVKNTPGVQEQLNKFLF